MLDLLFTDPLFFIIVAVIFVMSLTVHEYAHALAAYKLGDPTAKFMGRLTLNPLAHLDPIGTLMILLVRFGWGKPVPVNTAAFKNPRRDSALVAFAGPLSNILVSVLVAAIVFIIPMSGAFEAILTLSATFNLVLAFFNLIPIFPLDGFNIVYGILPIDLAWQWKDTARYGMIVLLILIMTGYAGNLIFPVVQFLLRLLGL